MGSSRFLRFFLAALSVPALAGLSAASRIVTLDEVLQTAREHQPQLQQARAQTQAAVHRVGEALAPLLPQLNLTGSYQRTTANFVFRPGSNPQALNQSTTSTFNTFDFYNFGAQANQLLYDFEQTSGKWRAAQASASAQADTERATLLQILLTARTSFFNARATKALVEVAKETLENQDKHLKQTEAFVQVGTQPQIALAQARTDFANAQVQLVTARNNYEQAKAQLNQAIGIEGPTDYDVSDDTMNAIAGEDHDIDTLAEQAVDTRPEIASLNEQIRSQESTIRSLQGGYGPTIGVATGITDAGEKINQLGWNFAAGVTLTWPLFQGGLTKEQVSEAKANLAALSAQSDLTRQQIRLQVDQARLAVLAAKASISATAEALINAREQLRLAEGRYTTGVGSIIELGDAQVALTSAEAQKVQSDYNLATARAQLYQALGGL